MTFYIYVKFIIFNKQQKFFNLFLVIRLYLESETTIDRSIYH